MQQEMMGRQWHKLDYMQIICTSLQTDNHANTGNTLSLADAQPLTESKL